MMTAMIWYGVFNLFLGLGMSVRMHSEMYYWWSFLFNVYKRLFILLTFFTFFVVCKCCVGVVYEFW